jgi:Holliday junction resolvase RusA-like endonuclease
MKIEFNVPAVPVAQPRARATAINGMARMYEAKKSHPIHEFKATCRMACDSAFRKAPLTGPLHVMLEFLFPRPAAKQWKSRAMVREWKTTKPDVDNLAKAVFDALNGIMWADDSQIVTCSVGKMIASGDEQPGVKVTVIDLESA